MPSSTTALFIVLVLAVASNARNVNFKNSCPFTIDVEGTPNSGSVFVPCAGLGSGASCSWGVPSGGWQGNFHRKNPNGDIYGFPSATLAELNLANSGGGAWNYDWYDISIIPPGCPGSITSYDACWCNGGQDGYDVGMTLTLTACASTPRTCLERNCAGAYGYPNDNSKTSACTVVSGDVNVEFCPGGSFIDVGSSATSQTPPCRGGSDAGSPPSNPNPPPPANPPPSNPPPSNPPPSGGSIQWNSGGGITWAIGCDFVGNDIGSVQTPGANCGPACQANSQCTHFAWTPDANCWLKGNGASTSDAFVSGTQGIVCGVITSSSPPANPPPPPPPPPPPSNNGIQFTYSGSWAWASGCDFVGNDIGSVQTPASNCGPSCQANGQCTHFAWTPPANCWLKGNGVSTSDAIVSGTQGIVCGLNTASNAMADYQSAFASTDVVQAVPVQNTSPSTDAPSNSDLNNPLTITLLVVVAVLALLVVVLLVFIVKQKQTQDIRI